MPMPGQVLPRAAGNDPAETLASTLVSRLRPGTSHVRAVDQWPYQYRLLARGVPQLPNLSTRPKTVPTGPGSGESMKTTRTRRVRRAALFAVSAVGLRPPSSRPAPVGQ